MFNQPTTIVVTVATNPVTMMTAFLAPASSSSVVFMSCTVVAVASTVIFISACCASRVASRSLIVGVATLFISCYAPNVVQKATNVYSAWVLQDRFCDTSDR